MLSISLTLILGRDKVMLDTYFVVFIPCLDRVPSYPTWVKSHSISLDAVKSSIYPTRELVISYQH